MSSLLSGAIAAKREAAPKDESKKPGTSTTKPYLDALAALVPAEVLAISAVIVAGATKVSDDRTTTTITDAGRLEWTFYALLVLSVFLFLGGRLLAKERGKKAPKLWILALQCLIPPLAFIGWSMLQPVSAIDVIKPSLDTGDREAIAIIGAAFVGGLATVLGYQLDKTEPPAVTEDEPGGNVAGHVAA